MDVHSDVGYRTQLNLSEFPAKGSISRFGVCMCLLPVVQEGSRSTGFFLPFWVPREPASRASKLQSADVFFRDTPRCI